MCGNELTTKPKGRHRKYCSDECSRIAKNRASAEWRARGGKKRPATKPCAFCGESRARYKYCSTKCRERAKSGTDRAPRCRRCQSPIPVGPKRYCAECPTEKEKTVGFRSCPHCLCLFPVKNSVWSRRQQHCSPACARSSQRGCCIKRPREPKVGQCLWCGKTCSYRRGRRYCSADCQSFMKWYRDKRRAVSWRVEYLHCPNPDCGGIKTRRPSRRVRASCDDDCEAAFRLHQLDGGHSPNVGSNSWISRSRRLAIYERDGWICQLCHEPVDQALPGGMARGHSLHHVIERVHGGSDDSDNLVLAHSECNTADWIEKQGKQAALFA